MAAALLRLLPTVQLLIPSLVQLPLHRVRTPIRRPEMAQGSEIQGTVAVVTFDCAATCVVYGKIKEIHNTTGIEELRSFGVRNSSAATISTLEP